MRLIQSRAISIAAMLALLAGTAGFGASAFAASPTVTRTISVTDTTATINWTTDVPTEGNVSYGLTTPFTASTSMETSFSTTHSVTITGLTASTTYQYEIDVVDSSGNTGTSGQLAFTTNPSATVSAPVISNITVTPTSSGATITWNTDSAATTQAFYGTTASYGATTTLDSNLVMAHSVTITGLTASTTYHYSLQSGNSAGTATTADRTFDTLASSSSSTPFLSLGGVDSLSSLALPDNTYQDGFKWVLHFNVPDNESSLALRFNDFTSPTASTTIPISGNLRYFSAQSSNAGSESSAITESNNSYGTALQLGTASTTSGTRQVDVTVELKVPTGTQPGTYSGIFGALSQ